MNDFLECQNCGTLSKDKSDFATDIKMNIDEENLTCEDCYENMMEEE